MIDLLGGRTFWNLSGLVLNEKWLELSWDSLQQLRSLIYAVDMILSKWILNQILNMKFSEKPQVN